MQDLFAVHLWSPLKEYGLMSPFWSINLHTIYYTWVVLGVMAALIILARVTLARQYAIGSYLILTFAGALRDLCTQTLGEFNFRYFSFISSLFTFILLCNLISLIPGIEEPTSDLSTALALGLIALIYIQIESIRAKSIWGYLYEFLMPLNIIGELAKVLSISFRLYGNIFGGVVITKLYLGAIGGAFLFELAAVVTGVELIMTLFFGIFAGTIQAFVFAMLTLTYLTLATQKH